MEPKKKGRPPTPGDEKLVLRSLRLKQSHWDKVDKYGLAWLRALIDRAKPHK